MKKVAGVKLNILDKVYNFDQNNIILKKGDKAIVETEQGAELGTVVYADKEVDEKSLNNPLKPILRKATTSDTEKSKSYQDKEDETLQICKELAQKHKLEMKLVAVSYTFDGSKIIFYFTADSRVDFRQLVRELTKQFQKSIRMQQVGSRDVAAKAGGCGICGKELCCNRFLKDFTSITTDMAREQQMVQRGSSRISGVCGRLLCCLSYEEKMYKELSKEFPKVGERAKTSQGVGVIIGRNLIAGTVNIKTDDNERITVDLSELKR